MINRAKNILQNKYIVFAIAAAVIVAVITGFTAYGCILVSGDDVIDGVSVLNTDMSGKTQQEVEQFLDENLNVDDSLEIKFVCEDTEFSLTSSQINLKVDTQKTARQVINTGKNGNMLSRIFEGYNVKFSGKEILPVYACDENVMMAAINEKLGDKVCDVTPYSVELKDKKLIAKNGVDGKKVKETDIADKIYEVLIDSQSDNVIQLTVEQVAAEQIDADEFIKEYSREPKNAEYKLEDGKYTFTDEVYGLEFDKDAVKKVLDENRDNTESYEIPVVVTEPDITVNQLKNKFSVNTLATYATDYSSSDAGRSANIALAASKINGYVLNPGQRFSFNNVVGPRTKAAGFKIAHVFEGDKVVDGIGGGICQVSSTLYNAVVRADLKIVYRTNHSMPVSYVPIGTDATVSYGAIDFIFENNKKTPVTIEATTHNKLLKITIKGTDESDGVKIEITTENLGYTKYPTKEVIDEKLKPGETKVVTQGQNGSTYKAYKVYKKDGKVIKTEFLTKSVYIPVTKVVHVGPKKNETPKVENKPKEQPKQESTPKEQPKSQPETQPETQPEVKPETQVETQAETPEQIEPVKEVTVPSET